MKKKGVVLISVIVLIALAAGGFLYLYFTRCPKPPEKSAQASSALRAFPGNSGCCTGK